MKQINCCLCGDKEYATLYKQRFVDKYLQKISPEYTKIDRRIVICKKCGFIYRNPQIEEEELNILYQKFRDNSLLKVSPDRYFENITNLPMEKSENWAKVTWLNSKIGNFLIQPEVRVIDIGCGGGVFLHTFLKQFPQANSFGVEPTPIFADLTRRKLDIPVAEEMYRPGMFGQHPFDLICILQVFEHILDPLAFLFDIKQELATNGWIYIEVPDIADIGHLAKDHDRFHAQHLYIYSLPVLQHICNRVGLKIEHASVQMSVRSKYNLSILCRKKSEKTESSKDVEQFPLQDYQSILRQSQSA